MDKHIKQINEQLEQVIDKALQLNEMSKAFSFKNRSIEVCAWVEGPLSVDNRYFKYYNSMFYNLADKVARIRIDKPEYVGGNHKEHKIKKWILTEKEKRELVEILKGPSEEYDNLTRWQDILITYNRDNFNISAKNTIAGNLNDTQRNPKLAKYIKPFPIDYPMPNYIEL